MKTKISIRLLLPFFIAVLITGSAIKISANLNKQPAYLEKRVETNVYICVSKNAVAYHIDRNCRGLNRCTHEIDKVTIKQAQERGLRACKICSKSVSSDSDSPNTTPTPAYNNSKQSQSQSQESVQCSAITKKGTQCTRMTKYANGLCWQHGGHN